MDYEPQFRWEVLFQFVAVAAPDSFEQRRKLSGRTCNRQTTAWQFHHTAKKTPRYIEPRRQMESVPVGRKSSTLSHLLCLPERSPPNRVASQLTIDDLLNHSMSAFARY